MIFTAVTCNVTADVSEGETLANPEFLITSTSSSVPHKEKSNQQSVATTSGIISSGYMLQKFCDNGICSGSGDYCNNGCSRGSISGSCNETLGASDLLADCSCSTSDGQRAQTFSHGLSEETVKCTESYLIGILHQPHSPCSGQEAIYDIVNLYLASF